MRVRCKQRISLCTLCGLLHVRVEWWAVSQTYGGKIWPSRGTLGVRGRSHRHQATVCHWNGLLWTWHDPRQLWNWTLESRWFHFSLETNEKAGVIGSVNWMPVGMVSEPFTWNAFRSRSRLGAFQGCGFHWEWGRYVITVGYNRLIWSESCH